MGKTYRKYKIDEDFLLKESPEKYYFLGYFLADGHLSKESNQIIFEGKDIDIFNYLKKILKSEHPIKCRKRDTNCYIQFSSKKLLMDLVKKYNIRSNKAHNITMPIIPKKYFAEFLLGFIDGDGSIYLTKGKYVNLDLASMSNQFLKSIRNKIKELIGATGSYYYPRITYGYTETDAIRNYIYKNNKLAYKSKKLSRYPLKPNLRWRKWLIHDLEYLIKNYKYMLYKDIAKYLKRSVGSIETILKKRNLRKK